MKKQNLKYKHAGTAFICTLLLMTSAYTLSAHDDVMHRYELFWKQNSFKSVLTVQKQMLKLSELEMNAFVFANREAIAQSSSHYWTTANTRDSSSQVFEQVTELLTIQIAELSGKLKAFNKAKAINASEYNTILDAWGLDGVAQTYGTAPPPSTCLNPGFESGLVSGNIPYWEFWLGDACLFDMNLSCNNFPVGSSGYGAVVSTGRTELISTPGFDPTVPGNKLPKICPGGSYSLRLENMVNGGNAAKVRYTFTVGVANPVYAYKYALVLEEPTNPHLLEEKPYFLVSFYDRTLNEAFTCGNYMVYADADDNDFKREDIFMPVTPGSATKYTNWQRRVADMYDRIGHVIEVTFVISDCALGGHFGYVYLDGECLQDPVTVGPCLPDGTRNLTVAGLFPKYVWKGNGITGANSELTVNVNKEGPYKLVRMSSAGCRSQELVTVPACPPATPSLPCLIQLNSHSIGSCISNNNLFDLTLNFSLTLAPAKGVIKIQDGSIVHYLFLPQTNPIIFVFKNLYADGKMHNIVISFYKDNYMSDAAALCSYTLPVMAPAACFVPVINGGCIASFAPCPGEKYIVSAWVRDPGALASDPAFINPNIKIVYTGGGPNPSPAFASGKIIDGWQRVYMEFTIPVGVTVLTIELSTVSGTALFDDIRIYPLNGIMKSYVYDPASMKLMAELDENNYATFYEYDQEGTLIRTKKETERGIVTISENRQSNPKN
jgi:hypothetical protein